MADFESKLGAAKDTTARLLEAIGQVIVGQEEVVQQTLWAMIAGGHVLLEGAPGLGKTLLVRTLASCLDLHFSRIQFTPDLMPSDVTGTNILVSDEAGNKSFSLHKGPIFAQVILADEINRATPKTQSSLLEAMQEHACTIAGKRHAMVEPFMVLATENPIEMEGTYPTEDELTEILVRTTGHHKAPPSKILTGQEVLELRSLCRDVAVAEPVLRYAARLVGASEPDNDAAPVLVKRALRYGAGVRAAQSLILASKAVALLEGRGHVAFADIHQVSKPVLRHRMIRSFEGEADGITTDDVVDALVEHVPVRPAEVERASA